MFSLLVLFIHTLVFWFLILFLHKKSDKITLVPLYGLIGALTILTHVLSSANVSLPFGDFFFHISSTTYFTTLLLGVIILYLNNGPKAARTSLEIFIGVSVLQTITVLLIGLEDTNNIWISLTQFKA